MLSDTTPDTAAFASNAAYFDPVMQALSSDNRDLRTIDPHWFVRFVFLMGTHLCAMVQFHVKRGLGGAVSDQQPRAIALHCEGLVWLNAAYALIRRRYGSNERPWDYVRSHGVVG